MAFRLNRQASDNTETRVLSIQALPDPPVAPDAAAARIDSLARIVSGGRPALDAPARGARSAVDRAFARVLSRPAIDAPPALIGSATRRVAGSTPTFGPPVHTLTVRRGNTIPDPAHAVLIDTAGAAIARALPILGDLPTASGPNQREIAAIASSIKQTFEDLRAEVGRDIGPREPYVDDLLRRLGTPDVQQWALIEDLNTLLTSFVGPNRIPPDGDMRQHTAVQILRGIVDELWQAWNRYRADRNPADGTTQALAQNIRRAGDLLRIIADRQQELLHAFEAIDLTESDLAAFRLEAPAFINGEPLTTLADLLQMISDFATVRGPRLLELGDQTGLGDAQDEADAVFAWTDQALFDIRTALPGSAFHPLFDHRVDRPLFNLHTRLHDLASL